MGRSISIHALLAESDTSIAGRITSNGTFLSTLSLRRATLDPIKPRRFHYHFYPRSPCGERPVTTPAGAGSARDFYPRSPCGERQHESADDMFRHAFLSTLSLRRATKKCCLKRQPSAISIHALLAESDQAANSLADTPPQISIHALLAESDLNCSRNGLAILYFYPRSPCGERRHDPSGGRICQGFLSTLSLRRATNEDRYGQQYWRFLSTLSLRRATRIRQRNKLQDGNFYPRSPCGERLSLILKGFTGG